MTAPEETTPVRDAHRFDEKALERYLEERLADFRGPLEVRQFAGGQSNPTYYLTAGGREYVMRKKPPGQLLPSAHAVDREYRVVTALASTKVPVYRTYLLCEDPGVIGTTFYMMEYVRGRVFRNVALPGLEREERAAIYDAMNHVLARLHQVDYRGLGLEDYGKPGNYYARQISRWTRQYGLSKTDPIECMDRLMAWLPDHIPASDETTIVHGDYRLENMIFHPAEPRVLAVLDWELSTLGHPLGDLAYHCLVYHVTNTLTGGLASIDLEEAGIPGEQDYVDAYTRRTGRGPIADWSFYLSYSLFRSASIAQGVYARALQGNASSANARRAGEVVRGLAERAWSLVGGKNHSSELPPH